MCAVRQYERQTKLSSVLGHVKSGFTDTVLVSLFNSTKLLLTKTVHFSALAAVVSINRRRAAKHSRSSKTRDM